MSIVMSSLLSQTPQQSLLSVQKLLHMYPNYLWVLPLLPYLLLLLPGDTSDVARGYLNLVHLIGRHSPLLYDWV